MENNNISKTAEKLAYIGSNFHIFKNSEKYSSEEPRIYLKYSSFFFPCGEIGIKLDTFNYRFNSNEKPVNIIARIHNSNNVMELALIVDALRNLLGSRVLINLYLTYLPYARQDRVCVKGESFSVKVFANLINSLNFNSVTLFDPHSDVSSALFNNVKVYSQLDIIQSNYQFSNKVTTSFCSGFSSFISPDAGANKKTAEIAKYFGHKDFIRADKLRELETGKIKETIVYAEDLSDTTVFIVDDICDKGGTFILLAHALKKKNAKKVILYVTHGVFTAGTKILYEGGIDEIYTTNSYYDVWPAGIHDSVNTFDLNKLCNE